MAEQRPRRGGAGRPPLPPNAPGTATRRVALTLLDAVLRKGLPIESAVESAGRGLPRADDRALALAIAAEVLRRLPDLDALIDGATARPLPDDAKARSVLRIALVQALVLGTPPHAAISTALPLLEGGPRRLVHGVFGTLMRQEAKLPAVPTLPPGVALRWHAAWGDEAVEAAARLIAAPPPLDLCFPPAAPPDLEGESFAPGHLRLPRGQAVAGPDRLRRGPMVGAGFRRLDPGAPARRRRWPDRARSVRRAGRQDDAARRRRLPGHRRGFQRGAAGAAAREFRSAPACRPRWSPPTSTRWAPSRAGRRDPARRALLGDRHLPPPPGRAAPGAPVGDRRTGGRPGGDAAPRGRMAEAGRDVGLFGLLAGAAGGRGGGARLPRRASRLSPRSRPPGRAAGTGRAGPEGWLRLLPGLFEEAGGADSFFIARFVRSGG